MKRFSRFTMLPFRWTLGCERVIHRLTDSFPEIAQPRSWITTMCDTAYEALSLSSIRPIAANIVLWRLSVFTNPLLEVSRA